ncbi:uncharacterized protein LOC129729871 [Wyeomyia smithii]|uniref:uncharacterized protein LOC129729871 n=1 Tax=Wyeomyia smithii TaxID=174621 RepID=UPI002467DD99|nr:uncharacterized protein LOC129729871 [Wyeomyia smithii]
MVGYLEITPSTALIVLGEILSSFGIQVDEPNIANIEKQLSIPVGMDKLIVDEENREIVSAPVSNEVQLIAKEKRSSMDECNEETTLLSSTLSLSRLEAEFLRKQLQLLNLKACPIMDLFQYCDSFNSTCSHCLDTQKRASEMGLLMLQRAVN